MAIPQGNFVALQALTPKQYKVGDLNNQLVDFLIQKGEADKAAALKIAQEKQKSLNDQIEKINPDLYDTIQMYQGQVNAQWEDVLNRKDRAKRAAEVNDPNAQRYLQEAKNAERGYLVSKTIYGNKIFLDKNAENVKLVSDGKAFLGDDTYALSMALNSGAGKISIGEDGTAYLNYEPNPSQPSNDENNLKRIELDKIIGKVSGGIEVDTSEDTLKAVKSYNKTTDTTTTRGDGVVTTREGRKVFDESTNKAGIVTYLGFDNSKPLKDQYSSLSVISPRARHLFYRFKQRNIESGSDIEELINIALKEARTQADTSSESSRTVQLPSSSGSGNKNDDDNQPFVGSSVLSLVNKNNNNKPDYYQQEGVMIRGNAKVANEYNYLGAQKSKEVFVKVNWNPNGGRNREGGLAYTIAVPVEGGSFIEKPLGSIRDKTGMTSARKFLTDKSFEKLVQTAREHYSKPENRKAGTKITNGLPATYGNVDFKGIFPDNSLNAMTSSEQEELNKKLNKVK